uniref:Methyltransferase-like protein 24 n=1 Tax=Castor canadensis TaxID=51338 RepID=A0A8B7UFB0_CASCN|nr:methyltransferase-like protein 24 [Castor canadensis]
MKYKRNYWLTLGWSNTRVRYVKIRASSWRLLTINSATLLPIDLGPPEHDCLEVMDEVFSSWLDLTNQPIGNPDVEYFTGSSSFVQDGTHFAGFAVVTLDSVIEAHPLPVGSSAQKAKLVALTWALQLTVGVQIACNHVSTDSLSKDSSPAQKPWLVCLDDRFGLAHQIRNKQCRLYSLGLGSDDTHFEVSMANDGCEVHRFDPSVKSAHVLESQRLWHHRLSIDWRDPHPAVAALKPHSNTRKLGSILNEFGHHKIDVLKADLESAEWKVLENLIVEDVLEQIGQLIFEIHLHWPGFEVSGSDNSVVRFWYSVLKELEQRDFRLFHSYKDLSKPQQFLKKDMFNASSCYTLSWVNTRWK